MSEPQNNNIVKRKLLSKKVINPVFHYNKDTQKYKKLLVKRLLFEDGSEVVSIEIQEGIKNGDRKQIRLNVSANEMLELAKIFEAIAEDIIKKQIS